MRVTLDGSYQNHNTMFKSNQFIQYQNLSIFSSSWLRKQSSTYGLNPSTHPATTELPCPTQTSAQGRGEGKTPSPWQYHPPRPCPSPTSGIGVKEPQVTYSPAWGKGDKQTMVLTLTSPKESWITKTPPCQLPSSDSTYKTPDEGLWANGGKCPCFCLLHTCPPRS